MPGSPVPTKCSGYTKEPQSDSSSSSAANRKTSFQRTVKSNFCTYLRETTVHGVRYVAEGKNFFERLFWIGFITAGFISSGYMLTQSMNESYYNPILTTIDTTSVKNVPFPAVTVDAGRILNPWGYVEKIGDLVQMDCYTDKTLCPATERVKTDFKDLFEGVVEVMTDSFVKGEFEGKSLDQLEEIQKGMSFAKSYGGFRRDAASMAFIIQGNPKSDSIRYTKKELKIATAATFGKYSPSHNPVFEELGNKYVRPIFDGLRAFNNISDEDIVPCLQGEEDCQEALVEAYKILLPIFRLSSRPNQDIGFGHLMSFFTRKALSSQTKDTIFLSKKNAKVEEERLNAKLIQMMDNLSGKDLGVSSYELSKLLDLPHYASRAQAAYSEGNTHDCDYEQYSKAWEIWNRLGGVEEDPKFNNPHVAVPPCQNMSFAKGNGFEPCCELHNRYARELETILRIQKYSIQAPYFMQSTEEFDKDFERAPQILNYPQLPQSSHTRRNFNPRIFTCQYQSQLNKDPQNCALFARSYTNEGFGYSFNTGNFWDRHRKNDYNQLFFDIMFPHQSSEGDGIIYPETSGPAYGLNLALMLNEYTDIANGAAGRTDEQNSKFFKVVIHDPLKPANLRSEGVDIEAGYLSTFLITPSEITTTDAVKHLEEFRRKCRFRSEAENMTVFSEYTQAGCIFECQLKQAYKRCGCIPWNYPHVETAASSADAATTCDYRGAACFERIMSDTETSKNCEECLFDCDSYRYTYSVSSTALDIEALCKKGDSLKYFGEADYTLPKMFMRYFIQRAEGASINTGDMCRAKMKKVAVVQFQLASQIVTQIKRDIRVTFADLISNFGGTIGLFTGMSILSFIEVLFWLFRLIGGIKVDGDPSEEEPDKPPEERERKFTQKRPDNPWNVTKFGTKA